MFELYPDVLSVAQAAKALSIGKGSMYILLNTGIIKSIRIGSKYVIPKIYLIEFVNVSNHYTLRVEKGDNYNETYNRKSSN